MRGIALPVTPVVAEIINTVAPAMSSTEALNDVLGTIV